MMQSTMMLSVSLGDTQCIEPSDDFVFVQQPDQMSFGFKDDDDDDSYDYCEDVYSLVSTDQTLSECNEDMTLPDLKEDMVLTVPSMLLKDLDEAHAAAKLVQQHVDSEQRSVASSTLSYAQSTDLDDESRDDRVSARKDDAVTMSRISNKKRRKKLKLMKKAAAAASADQALSERARAAAWAQHASAQKARQQTKKPTGSRSSKVANIAVACATDTISSYRQELMNNAKHIKA
jgi:hypothetical protein